MDKMDAGRVRPGMDEGRRTKDEHGRTRTPVVPDVDMDVKIRVRIDALGRERAEFALLAPVRAEERMQALHAQLQAEITMRMEQFDAQIKMLQELLAEPAKEID